MGHLSRLPNSNDIPKSTEIFPYGADEFLDDVALLLNEHGKRCTMCQRVTRNQYLSNDLCPVCRGEKVRVISSDAGFRSSGFDGDGD